ncbi:MAG TPA: AMP-binding protein, partial [Bryobacteraceae bacterium]
DFSVWEIWGALAHGGVLAIVPGQIARSPRDFREFVRRERVTVLSQTPSAFSMFMAGSAGGNGTPELRYIVFGGEALDVATLKPWFEEHSGKGPLLVNMYGITETTVHVTHRFITKADLVNRHGSPIGRPIPAWNLCVLDQHGRPTPHGVVGELYVGGAGVARGYLNRPDLTAERFLASEFEPAGRLYKTGDLGRILADGSIEFAGRNDFQVKIRGFRIELGEIEACLTQYPGVREAVVAVREIAAGDKQLVAYFTSVQDDAPPQPEALREHVLNRLPSHMTPAAFVRLKSLPLTANFKLDRSALPEPSSDAYASAAYEAPRGEVECGLARIWQKVLKVDRVGRQDTFFQLGGESMRVITMISHARDCGWLLTPQQVLTHQSLAAIAAVALTIGADNAAGTEIRVPALTAEAALPEGIEQELPLSSLQLGMVFHNRLVPEAGLYHDVSSMEVRTPGWNEEIFSSVLAALVQKHAVLRTSFVVEHPRGPLQLVHREARIPLQIIDISSLGRQEQQQTIRDLIGDEKTKAFDLASPPLLRGFVHLRGPGILQFTLSFHHAILDGWSLALFHTELFEAYAELYARNERCPVLPPLAVTFAAAVRSELRALQSDETRRFWKEYLAQRPAFSFPALHRDGRKMHGRRLEVRVPAKLKNELRALAAQLATPLRTVLLAAHVRVMSLLSGHDDVVTGVISHVRPHERDGENVLGLFLNTAPIRVEAPASSWRDLIRATFESEVKSYPYREYPYFQMFLDNDRTPIVETVFNYVDFSVYNRLRDASGIKILSRTGIERTNFPLTANVVNSEQNLSLVFGCDPERFSLTQLENLGAYYLTVLESMAAGPDGPHYACDLLPAKERNKVVVEWNDTKLEPSRSKFIHELFEEHARRAPDAVALSFEGRQLSYVELNRRANRLAHRLRKSGVGPEARVAICVERGFDMIASLLAVLKAGGAYVPLDPEYPPERLKYMLGESAPSAVITQGHLLQGVLGASLETVLRDREVLDIADDSVWSCDTQENLAREVTGLTADHLAYIVFTSGSTGLPKGVMIEHHGVTNLALSKIEDFAIEPASRVLLFASFSFDGCGSQIAMALCSGATLYIPPRGPLPIGRPLADFIAENKITHATLPPAVLAKLESRESIDCVHTLIVAGDVVSGALVRHWAPGRRLINGYGPTEATVGAAWHYCSPDEPGNPPVGAPIANKRVYILNRHLQPLPIGVTGELYIGGSGIARG